MSAALLPGAEKPPTALQLNGVAQEGVSTVEATARNVCSPSTPVANPHDPSTSFTRKDCVLPVASLYEPLAPQLPLETQEIVCIDESSPLLSDPNPGIGSGVPHLPLSSSTTKAVWRSPLL